MLFLLAILAGRKYNTNGYKLLSKEAIMRLDELRKVDPTIDALVTDGENRGKEIGKEIGLDEAIRFRNLVMNGLSEEKAFEEMGIENQRYRDKLKSLIN